MPSGTGNAIARTIAAMVAATTVTACSLKGDTRSINSATELAIHCRTDEALAALDQAQQGGGLGEYLSYLERVGILRDAGRLAEADEALAAYMALPETASSDPEKTAQSIQEFIDKLRKERKERTGSATCR